MKKVLSIVLLLLAYNAKSQTKESEKVKELEIKIEEQAKDIKKLETLIDKLIDSDYRLTILTTPLKTVRKQCSEQLVYKEDGWYKSNICYYTFQHETIFEKKITLSEYLEFPKQYLNKK